MKKYIFFLMGAVCFLLSSSAVHANELNKSDANIIVMYWIRIRKSIFLLSAYR